MFEPFDKSYFERATNNIGSDVEGLVKDSNILSADTCTEICDPVKELVEFIRNSELQGEPFWEEFQKRFGFAQSLDRVTPMNAANLCPEPSALLDAANRLRLEYNNNVAQQMRSAEGKRVKQMEMVRRVVAQGVGLDDPEDLAMVRNASEANNAVNCGYRDWPRASDPAQRDNVVIWNENHPTNQEPWWLRSQWECRDQPGRGEGRIFDVIPVSFDHDEPERDIACAFTSRIDERTRFVSYTETSNTCGFRMPEGVIRRIWQYVQDHRYDCHIHIDGTMAWGARPVNLAKPYCHSFVSSAHKWFLGPKETGILYMAKERVKNFCPSIFGYDYKITVGRWEDMPETALRFELLGQRDDVNLIILGLTQTVWTALLSARQPYDRVAELAEYLKDRLEKSEHNWELVTPREPERSSGVVRVKAPKETREKNLYDWIYDNKEYRVAGSGDDETFRLCPHIYNTKKDVELAVEGMNAWYESK